MEYSFKEILEEQNVKQPVLFGNCSRTTPY